MSTTPTTTRRAFLRAAIAGAGATAVAAVTPLVAAAGTDDTSQVDEGAINLSEGATVLKSSSTQGAAFTGQSITGRPGLYGHTSASDPGDPDTGDDFAGVVGLGMGASAVGVLAREGAGAASALRVIGRARFSRSGRATVRAGRSARKVTMAKVTAQSLVLAVLAKDVPGRSVRAVVARDGSFTIHLNGPVSAETPVTFIVFD
jgi:hypothetical protein